MVHDLQDPDFVFDNGDFIGFVLGFQEGFSGSKLPSGLHFQLDNFPIGSFSQVPAELVNILQFLVSRLDKVLRVKIQLIRGNTTVGEAFLRLLVIRHVDFGNRPFMDVIF